MFLWDVSWKEWNLDWVICSNGIHYWALERKVSNEIWLLDFDLVFSGAWTFGYDRNWVIKRTLLSSGLRTFRNELVCDVMFAESYGHVSSEMTNCTILSYCLTFITAYSLKGRSESCRFFLFCFVTYILKFYFLNSDFASRVFIVTEHFVVMFAIIICKVWCQCLDLVPVARFCLRTLLDRRMEIFKYKSAPKTRPLSNCALGSVHKRNALQRDVPDVYTAPHNCLKPYSFSEGFGS